MTTGRQRKTFISYSSVDKEFALELARELRSSGFDIWLDQLDIPTGARWDDEVERALDECEIFMVILTPASSTSDNVKDEIGYAIDTNKRILPILLENARVPLRLRRFQYVDFTSKSYEEGVNSAKQLLKRLIDEPTVPGSEMPAASQVRKAVADRQAKEETEQPSPSQAQAEEPGSKPFAAEREKLLKAATLMTQGKQLLQNGNLEEAAKTFRQILTLLPNHEKTLALLAEAEAGLSQERESSDRKAKEEANQLTKQKVEEDWLANAEADRKAKEEADRLAAQRTEKERIEREKANRERLALAETNRKAKENADRPAVLKAEEERLPKVDSAPKKKRSVRGLVIGGILVAVLCVAGIGIGLMVFSNGGSAATEAPTITEAPATEAPVTEAPPTEAPATEVQATEAPVVDSLSTEPPSGSSACSQEGSQPVQVLFENLTDLTLDYYWIDYDCQPQYYGTLSAGESKAIDTYTSHVWQFVDDQTGDVYLEYTADVNGYLEITSDASATTVPALSFSEDFSNNSRDWTTGAQDNEWWAGSLAIDNGAYIWDIEQIKKENFVYRFHYPNNSSVENIDISIDVLRVNGTPNNFCYGFYFRYSEGAYYAFMICDNQYYRVRYYDGSKWDSLQDWTRDVTIRSNGWNNIRVITQDEKFSFYINNALIATLSDSRLTKGYAGLLIAVYDTVPGQVKFDNFQVTEK